MYDLNSLDLKSNLRKYRKLYGYSLEDLGASIGKSKATLSKYEKGTILPDIYTILAICNTLNINLSQLIAPQKNENNSRQVNPFNTNKIYLYYYSGNKPILSVIEISKISNEAKLYNGVRNIKNYEKEYTYYYEGTIECDQTIGYFNLCNVTSQGTQQEKIQISFPIRWTKNFRLSNFFMLGLTSSSIPVIKKGIMSASPIRDIKNYDTDLLITRQDLKAIRSDNCWILEDSNYDRFFYDIFEDFQ